MKLIHSYIMVEVIKKFSAMFLIGICILLLTRFYIVADLVLKAKMGPLATLAFVVNFLPHYSGFMVLASLYWAIYSTVSWLHFHSETTAAFALNISPFRLFYPLFLFGCLASAFSLFVFGWSEPIARYDYRSRTFEIEKMAWAQNVQENSFAMIGGKTVLVENVVYDQMQFGRFFIYGPHEQSQLAISAKGGELNVEDGVATVFLKHGTWLQIAENDSTALIENSNFETLDLKVDEFETNFRARGKDEQELTIPELAQNFNSPPLGTSSIEMITEFCRRLATGLAGLFVPFLAIGFALSWTRVPTTARRLAAVALPLIYFQVMVVGEVLSRSHIVSPYYFFGLAWAAMLLFSIIIFLNVAKRTSVWHLLKRFTTRPQ